MKWFYIQGFKTFRSTKPFVAPSFTDVSFFVNSNDVVDALLKYKKFLGSASLNRIPDIFEVNCKADGFESKIEKMCEPVRNLYGIYKVKRPITYEYDCDGKVFISV